MSDIYSAIKADHRAHRALLDEIAGTEGNSRARREAWRKFYCDVKSHAAAEEETFYSKLISKTWGQDRARHSVHEHKELDDIMEELNGMDMSSPGWLTRFKTLKHDYEHHMDEEESEVFERAREVIGSAEVVGYADLFQKRKLKELSLIEAKRTEALEE